MSRKKDEVVRTSLDLLYNISRELNTPLDLHTVLQRVVFLSMKNVGAINGSLIVLDDGGYPVESAMITGEDQIHENPIQQLRATLENGLAGWVIRNKQAALVPDTSQDERWLRRPDDALDRTGPKSAVSAPLLAHDKLVGVITLVHPKPGFFTTDHLALVQIIADQSGIAILNARLYAESQQKARVMTALADSAVVITASLSVEDVLQRILEQTGQALRVEVVSLALIDPQTEELVYQATSVKDHQRLVGVRLAPGLGVAGWVVRKGRGVVVPDVSKDSRFYPGVDRMLGYQTRAIACAPVRSRGQIIGVLEAQNPLEGVFNSDDLLVLTGIGSLAGTAIRHAQMYARLQAAHQRYRDLFEDSIDPILITDWDGNILEANRQVEWMVGVDRRTLQAMNIAKLGFVNHQLLGPRFEKLSSGPISSYEAVLRSEKRREVPIQVNACKVLIENVPQIQWILREISVQKNLDKLREDLLAMIIHDIQSPLTNVSSSLDLMAALLQKEDQAIQSLLGIALRSTGRIKRLTSSILDIRKLEAGQPVKIREPVQLQPLLCEAVEVASYITEGKNQEIRIDQDHELPEIQGDADMLRRVLINLLENASKYSPQGSKIILSASRVPDGVQIGVLDTGPGIRMENQERIFDKFIRLHEEVGSKGLGLGLSFCRLAVEGHGGRIWVENEPNAGAHFKFTLPA